MTTEIQVLDFFYAGKRETKQENRFYYDPARGEIMAATLNHAGHITDFTGPLKVESWKAWRRDWEGMMPDATRFSWKRRAPLTRGHVTALFDAIYDQLATEGCRFAMALSRRGLPTRDGGKSLGDYEAGEWEHDPGCNEDDRFWNPGYLAVDESSPLIQWLVRFRRS